MSESARTAAETLSLLEERLRRVNYALNGHTDGDIEPSPSEVKGSATARLRNLERNLQSLAAKSTTVNDVLTLQKQHPDLFHVNNPSDVPTTLSTASLASLILAHSKLYHSVSSQLPQVQDATIPDPSEAAKLVELLPRIQQLQVKQNAQAKEFAELRTRTAAVLEAWYESGVLGMGERWAGWEERLRDAEILIRRREAAKKRRTAPSKTLSVRL